MWTPKVGEKYWIYGRTRGNSLSLIWDDHPFDRDKLREGNVYRTREEAEKREHSSEYISETGDFLADCLVHCLTEEQVKGLVQLLAKTKLSEGLPHETWLAMKRYLEGRCL